jgi:hypothetical protein
MHNASQPGLRIATAAAVALAAYGPDVRAIDVTNPLADPGIRAVIDARHAAEQARGASPSISLDVRVTTNTTPAGCATAGNGPINVVEGTDVQYCYFVQNTGDTALSVHDIVSEQFGPVDMGLNQVLGVGASTLVRKVVATTLGNQINVATWYARETAPGYTQIVGTCTPPNITATGTAMNPGDDERIVIPLPEAMSIYGARSNQLSVCNNGFVSYPSAAATCPFGNLAFPRAVPALTLAPYWDDLDSETGSVYRGEFVYTQAPAATLGSTAYYVILWNQRSHFPGPGNTATFSLGLLRSGQGLDGYLFYCYQDTDFGSATLNYGASATVGVNRDAAAAMQFSFNTANQTQLGGPTTGLGYLPTATGATAQATDTAIVTVTPNIIFQNGFQLQL